MSKRTCDTCGKDKPLEGASVRRDISRAKTARTDMGSANSVDTLSDSVLERLFRTEEEKGVSNVNS
jgi:hypothetical protein